MKCVSCREQLARNLAEELVRQERISELDIGKEKGSDVSGRACATDIILSTQKELHTMQTGVVAVSLRDYSASEWYENDNAGEMSPWSSTESYPAFARIRLRENSGKNFKQRASPLLSTTWRPPPAQYTFADNRHGDALLITLPDTFNFHWSRLISYLAQPSSGILQTAKKQLFALRKIFGAKRDEVRGEWRKLHNAELHALYSSPDIIRNIKSRRLSWAGHVAHMGESKNANRVLAGRPEGKRLLGRPRRRWEDNIKMDLREMGYDDRDWINLAQDRDR
ncbi:hypothetical protein ANN_16310 [Periplaneta americana]|uniref:Uncharacterized protein n=1 Tax=Periplaneta americana TaxID=6978 RepID=A0ABQ8SIP0_PERAM|nr:hypothetical protein ANN_16310 [Periplaneta americana]